jgi:prepilin-type processing-associated H-X9-DG protein
MNNDPQDSSNTPPPALPSGSLSPTAIDPHQHQFKEFPVAAAIILNFLTCGLFSPIWINLMHGRLPKVRQDDPSAARAIGFCFIPFYNLYWIFVSYRRLCLRLDEQRELYGLPASDLRGMATVNCIFQVIPYINILGMIFVTPIFLGRLQSSVNELVRTSATTPPQRTLPVIAAPSGMSAGVAAVLVACLCFIPIVAILAALLLPALAAAKQKAQQINCVSNLKQVGLAFRIWEGDNNDQFPFNVSTNKGGTFELCDLGENGLDRNSWLHFQVMSNELATPKILVCPNDDKKEIALDFSHLDADHCTYLVHSGADVIDANPQAVLAICPIHRNVLFCDGSVQMLSQEQFYQLTNSLALHRVQ